METLTPAVEAPVVTLELEGPRPQRRWTVAFRIFLAVPHSFWLGLVGIAQYLAIVAAWFAALALGRMPDGLGTFIARVLQYTGRVYAYGTLLLTDRYPSFALDEPDYPVSVRAPYGGRLNRAAVLFRIVLVVPAAIAMSLVWMGLSLCLPVIWLIVLIAGRPPQALFEAEASVLRYMLRTYAYFAMLTSEYPRGLFGDKGLSTDEDVPVPVVAPDEPEAVTADVEPPRPSLLPRVTKLVLSKAAKRLVVLFTVLGVVLWIGLVILSAITSDADEARREFTDAYEVVYAASSDFGSAVQSCAVREGGLECVRAAAGDLRDAFADFRAELRAIDMPAGALSAAHEADEATAAVVDLLDQMAAAPDAGAYDARTGQLQQHFQRFDRAVVELDTVLAVSF